MDNNKTNLINPDTDVWLGFLSIFMSHAYNDDSWKELEKCVIGHDGETPVFDDEKVKRTLKKRGKKFRPYFEEMKKVVSDAKTEEIN